MGTVRSCKVFHPYTSESEIPIVCGVPEMCRIFQRCEPTICAWCREGKLPAFRVGESWFANKADLLNLVRLQK
ncbi:MAG: helix-turn-helix domain-containing protein [Acutalibacteraceae bacterium]